MHGNEEPKIGVYTCYCGGNISKIVQVEKVATALRKLPNVVVSRTDMSMCSDAGQAIIEQDIREHGINRVVIGACAPSLHEQTFRGTVSRAGLNPYLYHHVGLREQDSWVHHEDIPGATEKAIYLMAAGISKARLLSPLDNFRLPAEKRALVIGGGVAGMQAALEIAKQGLQVTLVEKSAELGGRMSLLGTVFPTGKEASTMLRTLIQQVISHERIQVLKSAEVENISGYVGNFQIKIRQTLLSPKEPTRLVEQSVGAIVMATGFDPYQPRTGEYGYGELPEVVTLSDFIVFLKENHDKKELQWNGRKVRDVVFIQCAGSRQVDGVSEPQADGQVNNYCSRVCCTAALHVANELKELYPDLHIFDLYQDIRTYGRGHEDYYLRAMKNKVRFLMYHGDELPQVVPAPEGEEYPVLLRTHDYLTYGEELEIAADLVVLAVGMMPRQIDDLVSMLKLSRGADRFLLEVHPKLRPVETAINGVVLAGTAQGPMNIQESVMAASAAAAKVTSLLRRGYVELPPFVAAVDPEKCDGSGACVEVCQYDGAIAIQTMYEDGREFRRAVVTPANCSGCGACVAVCPNRAINVQGWTLDQYEAMVDAIAMDAGLVMEAA